MAETPDRDAEWRQIEREAHDHALAVLDAEEKLPLVEGAPIAWVYCRFGRTDDVSHVHRVGQPVNGEPYTACHEAIPDIIRHMILTPALIRAMEPCRFCEAEYTRGKRHAA